MILMSLPPHWSQQGGCYTVGIEHSATLFVHSVVGWHGQQTDDLWFWVFHCWVLVLVLVIFGCETAGHRTRLSVEISTAVEFSPYYIASHPSSSGMLSVCSAVRCLYHGCVKMTRRSACTLRYAPHHEKVELLMMLWRHQV